MEDENKKLMGEPGPLHDQFGQAELKNAVLTVENQPGEQPKPIATGQVFKKPESRFKRLIKSKKFWAVTVFILLITLAVLWFLQPTRIAFVNLIGLKVQVKVTTRSLAEPGAPSSLLKNVNVIIDGQSFSSNENGEVVTKVDYGQFNVMAEKAGFEPASFADFYDFNPFFGLVGFKNNQEQKIELNMKSVGVPVSFVVKDWLSGKPVIGGRFAIGDVIAVPNEDGFVSVNIPPTDEKEVVVKPENPDYLDREFKVAIESETPQEQLLVPVGKSYFLSDKTGAIGVYSVNLDGSGEELVVSPSPNETNSAAFAVSPNGKYAAFASTRDGKRVANQLQQRLYIVNLTAGNTLQQVDEAPWFRLIDFNGDILAYTAQQDLDQRLNSVNLSNGQKYDLATAGSFGQARVSIDKVVYLMNDPEGGSGVENDPELHVALITGGSEKNIGSKVSNLTQTMFDMFVYQTPDNLWHQYSSNTDNTSNGSAPKSVNLAYLNSTSPNGQSRLFTDKVTGQYTLNVENVADGQKSSLYVGGNLQGQVRWVGPNVIFNVTTAGKTYTYAVSGLGGEPKKVIDSISTVPAINSVGYFSFL